MSDVTLIITSCNRLDLLKKTVDSFEKYCNFKFDKKIIVEDNPSTGDKQLVDLTLDYKDYSILHPLEKLGHCKAIDLAYTYVNTPYIFHCEDDWEFTDYGFVEKSLAILENTDLFQVLVRSSSDNPHTLIPEEHCLKDSIYKYPVSPWNDIWYGFSFNPGLIKKSFYDKLGNHAQYNEESLISKAYNQIGAKSVYLMPGYCKHIGWGRKCV